MEGSCQRPTPPPPPSLCHMAELPFTVCRFQFSFHRFRAQFHLGCGVVCFSFSVEFFIFCCVTCKKTWRFLSARLPDMWKLIRPHTT